MSCHAAPAGPVSQRASQRLCGHVTLRQRSTVAGLGGRPLASLLQSPVLARCSP